MFLVMYKHREKVYVISMIILINIAHAGQNWGAARVHGSTLKSRNLG